MFGSSQLKPVLTQEGRGHMRMAKKALGHCLCICSFHSSQCFTHICAFRLCHFQSNSTISILISTFLTSRMFDYCFINTPICYRQSQNIACLTYIYTQINLQKAHEARFNLKLWKDSCVETWKALRYIFIFLFVFQRKKKGGGTPDESWLGKREGKKGKN